MPLTRKRATIWTCSDGQDFLDIEDAAHHESWLKFYKIVHEALPHLDDSEIDNLWELRNELRYALHFTKTAFRREAVPADRTPETPR